MGWINVGHVAPTDTVEHAVGVAVPASKTWEVKAWVTNRTSSALTFAVRQAFADAAAANDQYRAGPTASCPANDIVVLPVFVMVATDKLYFTQSGVGLTCFADALEGPA